MRNLRDLLVHAAQYLAGRAGLMLLGFLSFPVLTRILPVAQYGELSLALKLCLLWTVLSKCGIQNAALRYFPEYSKRSPADKTACSSTLVLTAAAIAGALALCGFMAVHFMPAGISPALAGLVPFLLLLAYVRSIQPTFSGLLRSERRAWLFNACELSGKALGILFSITALVFIAHDLRFYLSGLVAAEGMVVIAIGVWFYRHGLLSTASFRPSAAVSALGFSMPLIAYELTSVILDSGDRILVGKYLGLTQLGLYSAAYSVATYAEEALMVPVNMALMPAYMKIWVEQGAAATSRFLSNALDLFIVGCGAVAMLIYVNSRDLLTILASRKFAAASSLLPILVLGLLVYAVHIFFNAPLIIHKRSIILTCVTTGCCAANVGMNVYLLPRIGIAGAAWATLLSYILMVIALAVVSRRHLVFRIPVYSFLCSAILVFVIQAVLGMAGFSKPWLNLAAKAPAALLLYTIGLLLLRPNLRNWITVRWQRQANLRTALSEAGQ
jgi:O-antigen/teichoic acid export membrane protein